MRHTNTCAAWLRMHLSATSTVFNVSIVLSETSWIVFWIKQVNCQRIGLRNKSLNRFGGPLMCSKMCSLNIEDAFIEHQF